MAFRNLQPKFRQGKGDQNKGREGTKGGGEGEGRVINHQKENRNGRCEVMKDKYEKNQVLTERRGGQSKLRH